LHINLVGSRVIERDWISGCHPHHNMIID
jgi:hypothetical protein